VFVLRYLIGHRGASGYEPENTMRSFRRAILDGANSLEMDLRMSCDGEIVLIHDRTVDRTTDGTGDVSELDLSTIRKLDAGCGERVPILDEVLRLADEHNATLFLELKAPGLAEMLLSALQDHDRIESAVVFGPPYLVEEVHGLDPRVGCTGPGKFRIGIRDLSVEGIAEMHSRGLVLIHGDIDEKEEIRRLMELKLDGIITNFPDRLAEVVESRQEN
jgi:glycerophosphoryl diester phosphodiesterase